MKRPPMILGKKPMLWLDDGIPENKFRPRCPETIDVDRLASEFGFDRDELSYYVANKITRIPRKDLAEYLGWRPRKVEAVRMRVQRKLAKIKANGLEAPELCKGLNATDYVSHGSSLHLFRIESLPSGRRVGALVGLPPAFAEIMLAERSRLFVNGKNIFPVSSNISGRRCSKTSNSTPLGRRFSSGQESGSRAIDAWKRPDEVDDMEKLICILAYQPRGRRKGVAIVASTENPKIIRQVADAALSELQREVSAETCAVVNALRPDEAGNLPSGPVAVCSREHSAAILQSAITGLS